MRSYLVVLSMLALLLPVATYAQDGRPTKPPPGAPVQTEEAALAVGSPLQLFADVRPQLGMELLSTVASPFFFEGFTVAGGDKYIDVGGDCVAGYTNSVASLGIVWPSDSGPVEMTFYADELDDTTAFLIWEMMPNQWWCSSDFFEEPTYSFDNMGMGVYYVWILTPQPQVASGWLDVYAP